MKRLTALLLSALIGSTSVAHDLKGIQAEQAALTPESRQRLDDVRELRRLLNDRALAGDRDLEAVVQKALRWEKSVLSVCFQDGQASTRERIRSVANEWTPQTSVRFDFGDGATPRTCSADAPSDIRIRLTGEGNWSHVGRHATAVAATLPTMHLSGMDHGKALSDYERFLVLHEFGHALGFEHEHQSPASGCSAEFDWKALPAVLGWTDDEVQRNMKRFDESSRKSGLVASDFDPGSVMLYALPVTAFLDAPKAKCYVARANRQLSALDLAGVRYLYPVLRTTLGPVPHPSVVVVGSRGSPEVRARLARLWAANR